MSDDRLRDNEVIEHLLDGVGVDDDLRPLGAELRRLRSAADADVRPDHRLAAMFEAGVPEPAPPKPRWLQRPAVAFAAAFVGVLAVVGGIFALVDRSPDEAAVAAPSTSSPATTQAPVGAGETVVSVPGEVSESVGEYLTCVVTEVGGYLKRKVTDAQLLDRPRVLAECGVPAVPPLGEEAEAFRVALNEWLTCAAESFDAMLPELFTDPTAINDPLEECGAPPNPFDYGIAFEFDGLDLDFLENIELPDIDLEGLFDRFSESLPEDFFEQLPEGFAVPDLDLLFEEFRKSLPEGIEGFGDFDLEGLLEQLEGFEGFDGFEQFDSEQLEQLWRDLGDVLPELDGLLDGFLERLPDDFRFEDFELWLNGDYLGGGEACEALRELGIVDECADAAGVSSSA